MVKLYSFENPILGLVTMPAFNEPLKGKSLIPQDATFKVDVEKSTISVVYDKKVVDIGKQVTYLVELS